MAIEVEAGTMYQCNITGAITDLDSVRGLALLVDFSFVSVEVGIPFATSEGALTINNCIDVSRYICLHQIHDTFNSWHACTASVTVFGLYVCLMHSFHILQKT